MARLGSGRLLKVASLDWPMVECVWFDARGEIHVRDYDVHALEPFWLASSPKSTWPEVRDMPDDMVQAADATAAVRRRERARKPKPSNKIKRGD